MSVESIFKSDRVCPLGTRELVDRVIQFTELLTNVKFYTYQSIFARRIAESIVDGEGSIITGLWARQCLHGDTVILDRDGSMCRIKDHPRAWSTGYRDDILVVTASSGQKVRATTNHPFFTKRGWVNAENLTKDDYICLLKGWEVFGNGEVTYEQSEFVNCWRVDDIKETYSINVNKAKILGYLTADGYSFKALGKGQSIKFTNINEAYLREFELLMSEEFPDVACKRYIKGKGFDIVCTSRGVKGRNPLRRFLAAMAPDAGFPTAIALASKEAIIAFLNRMYSADGCAYNRKDGSGSLELSCGGDEVYAEYVVTLLARLGILSRVKEEVMSNNLFYRVQIADRGNIGVFLRVIGNIYGKEAACDKIETGYGTRWSNRKEEVAPTGEDGEARVWLRVRSVEHWGSGTVYDIEFPRKGWFIAQGISVHNSGKTETIANICVGMALLLPELHKAFPDDARLKPFAKGFWLGIYAPIKEQAAISFSRMRAIVSSDHGKAIMENELGVKLTIDRADTLGFSNGSTAIARSASPDTQTEGKTLHAVIAEEAQKLSRENVEKELSPFLASTNGTMVKIGTAWESRGGFHLSIQQNITEHENGGKRSHFEFPYDIVIAEKFRAYTLDNNESHLNYEKYVMRKKAELGGETSPEFRMNFMCLWSESRVIAVTQSIFQAAGKADLETCLHSHMLQVGGLDIGKISDSTVLTVINVDIHRPIENIFRTADADLDKQRYYRKYVADWVELGGAFEGSSGQYRRLVEAILQTNLKVLCIDTTGMGDPVFERINEMIGGNITCVPFKFGLINKANLYKYYLNELHSGRLLYPAGPSTKSRIEYSRFVKQHLELDKVLHGGYAVCQAPEGGHDDYPDSAALACWAEKMMEDAIMPEIEVTSAPIGGGSGRRSYDEGQKFMGQDISGCGTTDISASIGGRAARYARR